METDSCCNRSLGFFIIGFSRAWEMIQLQFLPLKTHKVQNWDKIIRITVISLCKHLINGCFTVVIETNIPRREEHCETVEVINERQTLQRFQSPVGCCCFT